MIPNTQIGFVYSMSWYLISDIDVMWCDVTIMKDDFLHFILGINLNFWSECQSYHRALAYDHTYRQGTPRILVNADENWLWQKDDNQGNSQVGDNVIYLLRTSSRRLLFLLLSYFSHHLLTIGNICNLYTPWPVASSCTCPPDLSIYPGHLLLNYIQTNWDAENKMKHKSPA